MKSKKKYCQINSDEYQILKFSGNKDLQNFPKFRKVFLIEVDSAQK